MRNPTRQRRSKNVEDLLKKFAEALPNDIRVCRGNGAEARYGFKVSSKENLNNALAEAQKKVPAEAVAGIVRRVFQERFSDSHRRPARPDGTSEHILADRLAWRRPARTDIVGSRWRAECGSPAADVVGWEVLSDRRPTIPAPLRAASQIFRGSFGSRTHLGRRDREDSGLSCVLAPTWNFAEKFSEQIRASAHAHSLAVEKIVNRNFLEDGKLVIEGFDYNFTEERRSAPNPFGTVLVDA